MLTSFTGPQIISFDDVVSQRMAKKCMKMKKRKNHCACSLNAQFVTSSLPSSVPYIIFCFSCTSVLTAFSVHIGFKFALLFFCSLKNEKALYAVFFVSEWGGFRALEILVFFSSTRNVSLLSEYILLRSRLSGCHATLPRGSVT